MAEDVFVVYSNVLFYVLAHLTFDTSGLNPKHLYLYTITIFADQDCLLFVTLKHLSRVGIFHLFRPKVLPKKVFLLLGIFSAAWNIYME